MNKRELKKIFAECYPDFDDRELEQIMEDQEQTMKAIAPSKHRAISTHIVPQSTRSRRTKKTLPSGDIVYICACAEPLARPKNDAFVLYQGGDAFADNSTTYNVAMRCRRCKKQQEFDFDEIAQSLGYENIYALMEQAGFEDVAHEERDKHRVLLYAEEIRRATGKLIPLSKMPKLPQYSNPVRRAEWCVHFNTRIIRETLLTK